MVDKQGQGYQREMLMAGKHYLQHRDPQGEGLVCRAEDDSHCVCWCEPRVIPCGEDESQKHEAQLNGDYYEQYEDEAEFVQVNVWVGESVTEGGVDDHEKHAAADHAERRFLPFEPVLDVSSDDLSDNKRNHHRHKELRENRCKRHGRG